MAAGKSSSLGLLSMRLQLVKYDCNHNDHTLEDCLPEGGDANHGNTKTSFSNDENYTFSSFLAYLYSINTIFIIYKHAISFFSIRGE